MQRWTWLPVDVPAWSGVCGRGGAGRGGGVGFQNVDGGPRALQTDRRAGRGQDHWAEGGGIVDDA